MIFAALVIAQLTNTIPRCFGTSVYSNDCPLVGAATTNSVTVVGQGSCALGYEKVMRENMQIACAKTDDLNNHPVSQ